VGIAAAFPNGDLTAENFSEQQEYFVQSKNETKASRLSKALYGLKRLARSQKDEILSFLEDLSFGRSGVEPCLYEALKLGGICWSSEGTREVFSFWNSGVISTGSEA